MTEVAAAWSVSRQTLHDWLSRYEDGGLEALADRSHRPASCPHQMVAEVEVAVLEMRRVHPGWGPRRIVFELAKKDITTSESAVYRALRRADLIDPTARRRRREQWKRWERGRPMELWQMDVVGGIGLRDGSTLKCLTGVDDHSRFCVCAALLTRERTQLVCDAFAAALRTHAVPEQILTDRPGASTQPVPQMTRSDIIACMELLIELDSPADESAFRDVLRAIPGTHRPIYKWDDDDLEWVKRSGGGKMHSAQYFVLSDVTEPQIKEVERSLAQTSNWPEGRPVWRILDTREAKSWPSR